MLGESASSRFVRCVRPKLACGSSSAGNFVKSLSAVSTLTANSSSRETGAQLDAIHAAGQRIGKRPAAAIGVRGHAHFLVRRPARSTFTLRPALARVCSESPSGWPTPTLCSTICPHTASASISCTSGTKLGQAGIVVQGFLVAGSIDDSEPSVATRIERPRSIGCFDDGRVAAIECQRHFGLRVAGSTARRKYLYTGVVSRPDCFAAPGTR